MRLEIRHGTEGPKHDPYGYTERTAVMPNGVMYTLHTGLQGYLKRNGTIISVDGLMDVSEALFQSRTGLTERQFDRAYARIRSRCQCGSKRLGRAAGFPGETFTVCADCGSVVAVDFNEEAVI